MNVSGKSFSLFPFSLEVKALKRAWSFCAWWGFLGAVSLCFSGCSNGDVDVLTREQMWEWLGHHIPVGTPVDAASAEMAKAGFECKQLTKTQAKIVDINKKATIGTYDLLKCERDDGSPPIIRHWEISMVLEGSKVKMFGVRYRDVYPEVVPEDKSGSEKP